MVAQKDLSRGKSSAREGRQASLRRLAGILIAGTLTANCSGSPPQVSGSSNIDPKYGVAASPRLVQEGELVPKGGGRAMIGRPYMVAGQSYTPSFDPNYSAVGEASWYGTAFHGRQTANGEVFDKESVAAAHPTLPLPSYVRVTNLANRRSMVVRVNDRGPYHAGRLIDVSQRVAEALDFRHYGTTRVKIDYLREASVMGADDEKLMATLRTDGALARLPSGELTPLSVAANGIAPVPPQRPFDLGLVRGASGQRQVIATSLR